MGHRTWTRASSVALAAALGLVAAVAVWPTPADAQGVRVETFHRPAMSWSPGPSRPWGHGTWGWHSPAPHHFHPHHFGPPHFHHHFWWHHPGHVGIWWWSPPHRVWVPGGWVWTGTGWAWQEGFWR